MRSDHRHLRKNAVIEEVRLNVLKHRTYATIHRCSIFRNCAPALGGNAS
jgi:hypothetical protein